jgi:hypothetical protein
MQTNKDKVEIRVINMNFDLAFQYSFHGTLCCGQQFTQKLEITLEASELESITQQFTQNWE